MTCGMAYVLCMKENFAKMMPQISAEWRHQRLYLFWANKWWWWWWHVTAGERPIPCRRSPAVGARRPLQDRQDDRRCPPVLAHTSASFNLGQSYVTQPSHSFGQQPGSASETAFRGRVSAMDVLVRRNPGLISTKHGRRLVSGCASQVSRYSGSYKLINIHIVIQHSVWRQTCICFAKKTLMIFYAAVPYEATLRVAPMHLSVCLSVCRVPYSNSRTKTRRECCCPG